MLICTRVFLGPLIVLLLQFLSSPLAFSASQSATSEKSLVPRSAIFAKQTVYSPRLNADGSKLAWLDASAPGRIFIKDIACLPCDTPPASFELPEGGKPFVFHWTKINDAMTVVYSSSTKKRMDIARYNTKSNEFISLFPEQGVTGVFSHSSENTFSKAVFSIFKVSEPDQSDRYFRIDFDNGQRLPITPDDGILQVEALGDGFIGVDLKSASGDLQWVYREKKHKQVLASLNDIDLLYQAGFLTGYLDDAKNPHALFLDSSSRDTMVVTDIDIKAAKKTIIGEHQADIRNVLIRPGKGLDAYVKNYLKPEWVVTLPAIAPDIAFLNQPTQMLTGIWSRTNNDQRWLVTQVNNGGQQKIAIYDRTEKKLTAVNLTQTKQVEIDPALTVHAQVIRARDNTPLVSYLLTPAGKACQNNDCPMVVYIHGGPRARDEYPRSPLLAWLADRGYAVLTVNYRGSRGFGKAYEALNIGQWGLAMQDDVLDAVEWAIQNKFADPKRIAVMGGSHGGFLAINSITVKPDKFACAVASAASANLVSFVEKVTADQPQLGDDLYSSVGDVRKPDVKAALLARSPISKIDAVKVPILITHGAKDRQAPLSDMEEYASALAAKGGKVAFVVFPNERHGINDQETKLTYYGIVENFLATCLGGQFESVTAGLDKNKIDIRMGTPLFPFLNKAVKNEATSAK